MPREKFTPVGLNRDIPASDLEPNIWTQAENVAFRRGLAQRVSRGSEVFGMPPAPPVSVTSSITFDLNAWIFAADDGITQTVQVSDGNAYQDITPVGGLSWTAENNSITDGNVSGLPFLNFLGDQVGTGRGYFWDRDFATPSPMLPLPGLDAADPPLNDNTFVPISNVKRSHVNRIIAINTLNDPAINFPASEQTVIWSSLPSPSTDFPNDWLPRIDNSAGSAQLSGGGPLIDGASLRSSFIVYAQDRTFIMDEIGGSFVFSIRKLSSTTGILSRNCVAATPIGHIVLSGDDVFLNDGTNFTSIVDNVVKVDLFSQMGDNFQNSFVLNYAARSEVWVCIPTGGSTYPTLAYVYDLGVKKWGKRELPEIPAGDTGPVPFPAASTGAWQDQGTLEWQDANRPWNSAVLQSAVAGLVLADPDVAGSGTARRFISMDNLVPGVPSADMFTNSSITRADLDLGDASKRKTVRRIWPRIDSADDQTGALITVTALARDTLDGSAAANSGAGSFTIGVDEKVDLFCQGKYITVSFSQTTGTGWLLAGFDIEYETAGNF